MAIRTKRRERRLAGLGRRVGRLEKALGSLLLYLTALGVIGEEDFGVLRREMETDGIPVPSPRRAPPG
jgi:hypothetical protein